MYETEALNFCRRNAYLLPFYFLSAKKQVFLAEPMKFILHSLFLFSFCLRLPAQKETTTQKGDASEYALQNYKASPGDRLILEFNHTNWLGAPKTIKADWKSVGFGLYTLFDKPIGHSCFSIGYGLGLYGHNYSSNANFVYKLDSVSKRVKTILEPKSIPYASNRYNERSIELPLEIRYRSKTTRSFKLMLGAKVGYVVSNFKKTNDADGKIRRYDIKNINRLRYGIHARIGVEQLCFTASYYLSEVFSTDGVKGVHPFSIGLAIVPY